MVPFVPSPSSIRYNAGRYVGRIVRGLAGSWHLQWYEGGHTGGLGIAVVDGPLLLHYCTSKVKGNR